MTTLGLKVVLSCKFYVSSSLPTQIRLEYFHVGKLVRDLYVQNKNEFVSNNDSLLSPCFLNKYHRFTIYFCEIVIKWGTLAILIDKSLFRLNHYQNNCFSYNKIEPALAFFEYNCQNWKIFLCKTAPRSLHLETFYIEKGTHKEQAGWSRIKIMIRNLGTFCVRLRSLSE